MKERPTLFSAPMVLALLAGRKTMTRRIVHERHLVERGGDPMDPRSAESVPWSGPSPFGKPGDRLWVKETWRHGLPVDTSERSYRGGDTRTVLYRSTDGELLGLKKGWKPSIFMPRWASRIDLEVTEIRIECLQKITEEDAMAEGVATETDGIIRGCVGGVFSSHRHAFAALWDRINGKRAAWKSDPWVWVVSFRRLRP